jgi:hypothetical protein
MDKYRCKPNIVEAIQWFPDIHVPYVCKKQDYYNYRGEFYPSGDPYPVVHTIVVEVCVSPGDYIVVGECGQKFVYKEETFHRLYEKVD